MSANSFGTLFQVSTFGESHGEALGVVIDGIPSGFPLDIKKIQEEMNRRAPGQSSIVTPRKEEDRIEILSGFFEGKTTGTPLTLILKNNNAKSQDYHNLKECFRPSHADFAYSNRFSHYDYRGGGRTSGRETAMRVAAGSIAKQLLAKEGISIVASTLSIGPIIAENYQPEQIEKNPVRCADADAAKKMEALILETAKRGDSVGGTIQCKIQGVDAGVGEPVFDKLDALLAHAMLSIGAVKGIEFGLGFEAATLYASQYNDQRDKKGYLSNHGGGIEGGISNGNEIELRLAIKPTPSIRIAQKSIDKQGGEINLQVTGRHDPCICPRIIPVVEAMAALVLIDLIYRKKALTVNFN